MEQTFRPSKQFIIRGSVAIGLLAIILTVQTNWFRNIFTKEDITTAPENTATVGDVVNKDSNQNGIMDWEEQLWGLDPTKALTNGVSNKELIEQKKKALGIDDTVDGNLNETDILARDLFTLTSALSQSDQVNDQALQGIAAKFGSVVDVKTISNHYSLSDLKTMKTSEASLKQYYGAMAKTMSRFTDDAADMEVVIASLETGDFSKISSLTQTATSYKNLAESIRGVTVPVGVQEYHLAIINSVYGIAQSFSYITQVEENGVNGLAGIAIYKGFSQRLTSTLLDLHDYFIRYGILVE